MILLEKTRNQLVSDSKNVKKERDGQTRYQKRLKSRIGSSVREYNSMNMNKLFKDNILDVNIQVYGETDNYKVTLSFGSILDELRTLGFMYYSFKRIPKSVFSMFIQFMDFFKIRLKSYLFIRILLK